MHPTILGELSLGRLADRRSRLEDLGRLPSLRPARDVEVLAMIERRALHGRGIGSVDCSLLVSIMLMPRTRLVTRDRPLAQVADELGTAA